MADDESVLATFYSQARGIKFYGTPSVGGHFLCELEPSNPHDDNCIALVMPPLTLGHLAREAALHLAPLLRSGLSVRALG